LSPTSIYEAGERDYRFMLVTDAISGLYERGAAEKQTIDGALLTTDNVLKRMKSAAHEI
jgi:hypothetical protein